MPINEVTPKKVQEMAHRGIKRMRNFRAARLMFLRNYLGQYYDRENGEVGTEALNLIFNAIRVLVPHIVMNFPKHRLESPYLGMKEYGELLGLGLEFHDKKIDIKTEYRKFLVDAIFTLGIMKTGLASSDSVYALDQYDQIDSGTIYSKTVDFDNFVCDPNSREHLFADAAILGDRMTVSRNILLESGLFKNDLVERLPRVGESRRESKAHSLSMRSINEQDNYDLEDDVEIIELWVPSANATIWLPGDEDIDFDEYLRIDDYYGVKEGPYTFLALTPPAPGNPLPPAMVGVWNDLHILANKMTKKIVDQAMRQKDVVAYKRSGADDAQEIIDAGDGEAVASDDPDTMRVISLGGQQSKNEQALMQLQGWFSMMAGNPERMGGQAQAAGTATQETLLQNNGMVGLDDMKDLMYIAAGQEARKRAWYLHTDPLMKLPLVRRQNIPPSMGVDPMTGAMVMQPGQQVEQQIILTPEARRGDFLDFMFTIETDSMSRVDSATRYAQAIDFFTKAMPAVFTAAQSAVALGVMFSPKAALLRLAKMAHLDWFEEVFNDPEFQMMMMQRMMMGPQMDVSKGQLGGPKPPGGEAGAAFAAGPFGGGMMGGMGGGGGANMAEILQNGQPGVVGGGAPGVMESLMSEFQQGAVPAQQMLKRGY